MTRCDFRNSRAHRAASNDATVRTVIAILFPRECRCAFGKEGTDPFPVVVAATGQTLIIALQVKLGVEGVGLCRVNRLLNQPQTKGG